MSSHGSVFRTSTMAGDASKIGGSATGLTADLVQSITSDGFTIGANNLVNASGTTYRWMAFGAGSNLDVGTYLGNGSTQTIGGMGFQGEMTFLMGAGNQQTMFRANQSSSTYDLMNSTGIADGLTAYTADGFTLGSSTSVNENATTYHYFNFNEASNYLKTGTYTGNGADNRNITGVGFESEFVLVKSTSTNNWIIGKTESTGYNVDMNVAGATNQIQALQSDGFQVGNDSAVNALSATYMYIAWQQHDVPLYVTTTADTSNGTTTSTYNLRANQGADSAISLREAIAAANATRNVNGVVDEIQFALSGSGSQVITTSLALSITDGISIDGTTQAGWSLQSNMPVIIDGNNGSYNAFTLSSAASGSTLRGLVIRDFQSDAIDISSADTTIAGNWIGQFNSDGSDPGSSKANQFAGVRVSGANNVTIGGTTAADRNVIAGAQYGVLIRGSSTNTVVSGNYIGTDISGNSLRGAMEYGVDMWETANAATIGGSTSASRNIIAGMTYNGIRLTNEANDNVVIRNNYIGLAANGTTVLGLGGSGIYILNGGDNTIIGGIGMGNVIMGTRWAGIEIEGASSGTVIQGNFIGINAAGTIVHGTGESGIFLESGASNTTIGGTTSGQGNTITDSGLLDSYYRAGISLLPTAGTGNSIIGNSIYDNRGIGIDLGSLGSATNDTLDSDSGVNNLQNYPVLTSATTSGSTVTVSGSINTTASITGLILHFYATPSAGNVNTRQGRRYLGSTTVNTDASGNATFTNVALTGFTGSVAAGELITATATTSGANGNTSEFSQGFIATTNAGNSTPSAMHLVSSTDGGITLNTVGYNSYLEAEDGNAVLSGRTQLSMEFQLRAGPVAGDFGYALVSYATPTDGDALYIGAHKSGSFEELVLQINGTTVGITTDIDMLFDGNQHTLTVTWNQSAGAYAMYRDGVLLGSGTGLATGQTIAAEGRLGFGVDLDAGGDTWQPGGLFQGTFTDIRVFSDVRTASEVAANFAGSVPYYEDNLVANWRLNDLSTENQTTDAVSGNSLVLRQLTQAWTSPDTPALQLRLNENSVTGTVVGQIQGLDIEREQRITALLAADSSLYYNAETGKFYKVVTTNTDWTVARTTAMSTTLNGVSGQLATIRSANENEFLAQFRAVVGKDMWLAGNDLTTEGTWRWQNAGSDVEAFWQGTSTGMRVNGAYTNWESGEPNDNGGLGDYMAMLANGRWDDDANNGGAAPNGYFIEWNADDVLDATHAITYSIVSQTVTGAFSIHSDSGVITVANGALLNFESQTSHTITVRVTDGNGATFDRSYTIALNNLTEESSSPSDLSSGINLNIDGGNNAYLMTSSGGSVFGGLTALTLEAQFSIANNASLDNPLVSYNVAGSDNEVLLMVSSAGRITLALDGTTTTSTSSFAQLLDGKAHSVAVSWDNTLGEMRFYVDGQLVETRTGIKTSIAIDGGGTLVVGQEQDSVNGGYNTTQRFSGTLYDIRVWDRAISDEQIALNYQHVPGSTETGLRANWRMSGLSGGNTVIDSVGGVNLTVANVAVGGGFTTSTPSAGLQVNENASAGTRVGQVFATDPDISLNINADGLFSESTPTTDRYGVTGNFGNWTVTRGSIDLFAKSSWASPLGGRVVNLDGASPSTIEQTLTTVAGRQYQVIFNFTGDFSGGEAVKNLRVSADGQSADYAVAQSSNWSWGNTNAFESRSFTFTADSTAATLSFASLEGASSTYGPYIADVRVIEIPQAVQALLSADASLRYDAATGKFYKAVASNQTFSNAQSAAIAETINGISGQLATIGSKYENDLIWELARGINSNIWLGASDTAVEGTWRWNIGASGGTTFWIGNSGGTRQAGLYTNWASGEPNDFGGAEDSLTMTVSDGLWNDASGTNVPRAYVIEWDASEILSNFRYTITSDPSGAFAINANTGEITVANATPLNEIATDPTITVQVTDAAGNSYSESFTIAVSRVNDNAPVITSNGGGATASISVAENTTTITTIAATDADLPSQTLTYSIVGGADASLFAIDSSTGALTFLTARNFESPADVGANNIYDVTVRVSDGTLWDDQAIAVTVTNVNESPSFVPIGSTAQSATIAITVDNVYNLYVNGVLVGSDANWNDIETFTTTLQVGDVVAIEATDTSGAAAMIAAIDFTNGARVVSGADWRIATTFEVGWNTAGFNDTNWIRATSHGDRTHPTWNSQISSDPDYARLADANWIWAADVNAVDQVYFRYVVADVFTVTENSANGTAVGRVLASDVDAGDTMSYTLLSQSVTGAFSVNASTGQVTVANSSLLNYESTTTHSIVVRATDAGGLSADRTVTINIANANEAPTAAADSATAVEAGGVSNGTAGTNPTGNVLTNDSDVDAGDTKTVSGVAAGTVGSASTNVGTSVSGTYGTINIAASGSYTYTIDNSNSAVQALRTSGQTLTDVFTYTMRDAAGLTSTTQITVTIQGANDTPSDITGTLTVAENSADGTVVGTVSTTDVDSGDTFTYALTNNASGRFSINTTTGQVTVANGSLLDFETNTSHTIVVQTTDAAGASFSKTVTVAVTGVNEGPAAVNDSATAVEAGGVSNGTVGTNPTGNVLTNDTDVDASDTKTVTGVAAGSLASASGSVGSGVIGTYGSINIAADGSYTYTVDNSNAAVQALRTTANTLNDVFTYTMRDAAGLTSSTQITVTIQGANDAPSDIALVGNSGTNLVTNGSFETNNGAANTFSAGAGVTISGWTAIGGEGFEIWNNYSGGGPAAASSGISMLELDVSLGVNGISQNITTAAGQKYVLSFDFSGRSTAPSSSIEVYWQNQLIGTVTNSAVGWNTYSFVVTGSGGADNLKFMELASENDSNGSLLDNVRLVADQSSSITVAENSANGTVVARAGASDVDAVSRDTITYSLTNSASGAFAINATTGVITVADSTLLNFESTPSRTIAVRATDAAGATVDRTFTIGLSNVNEAPTAVADSDTAVEAGGVSNGTAGANPTGNVLTNDTDIDASDTKTVTGVVAGTVGSASGNVASSVAGTYGSISIAANGSYTYTVDNTNAAVQALRTSSNTLQDVYTYTMTDAGGLTSTTQITVTIQGANDAPNQSAIEGTALSYTENAGAVAITSTLTLADVDDANLTSATVQITGNYVAGQDQLSFTDQNGITGSWNSTNGTLTLTGSASTANYQAALRSITYTNSSEAPSTSTRTVSFTVSDGALSSSVATRNIAITAVNDAPVNLLPGVQTTGVNTSVTLSGANALQISDADAASSTVRITLTAAGGTMTLGSTAGLSFTTGDGTADASMVIQGTVAAINAALDGMSFAPTNNFNGTATITLQSEDLGNTGTGGNLSDTDVLTIQVGGLRFQEGVDGYTGTQDTYVTSNPGNSAFGSATTVMVDDPSAHGLIRFDNLFGNGAGQIAVGSTITNATLSIYVTATDNLDFINVHRMLSSWSELSTWNGMSSGVQTNNVEASTTILTNFSAGQAGWVTITGITSTVQAWANGAANHGFVLLGDNADNWAFNSSEFATASLRPYLSIAFQSPQSADIDLDSNNNSGATGSSFQRTWTENGGAVTIADIDATITDADSSTLQSMTVTIANQLDGTLETLAANTAGTSITATYNSATGQLTLSGNDTVANYQTVLRTVTYNNSSESPNTTSRLITVQAADAFVTSNLATATISVVAVNDAPVLDNSGTMTLTTITEDQTAGSGQTVASIIASAGGDRITDVDSGAVEGIAVTSTTNGNGTWEYSVNGGTTWTQVGTVADSSALLLRSTDLLRFIPNGQNATTGDITFRVWDQTGATSGQQGSKVDTSLNGGTSAYSSATEGASITVTAVNDAPTLDAARSPVLTSVSEHAGPPAGAVGTLVSSLIDFASPAGQVDNVTDVDTSATTGIAITATNAVNGTWWYTTDNGATWQRIGNVSTAAARLLTADASTRVYFEPSQSTEFSGTISNAITFRAWDGTSGSNGGTADTTSNGGTTAFSTNTDTAAITINNVNDAPRILGSELITNGDFTTNLSGWTASGSVGAVSGRANFGLGNVVGPHSISQTISTVAGQTYQLSFDYLDGSSTLNQSLVASVNGIGNLLTTPHIVTDVATTAPGARYTFTFVADSSSTTITLTDTSDQSGLSSGTTNVDGLVDNVSVRQLAGQMGTLNYTENAGQVAIYSTLNLSDFDSTNLVGATVQITSGFSSSQDLLAFTNQLGITGNYNSTTGVLTLTGTTTVANYETALRSITYQNTSDAPSSARTISFTVDDGLATSAVGNRSVAITNVNDAPTAVADTTTAVEAGGVANGTNGTNPTGNVLTNDTDVDTGDTKTVSGVVAGVAGSASSNVGSAVTGSYGSINIAADGSYTYIVDNTNSAVQALRTLANTLTDVFTYTMRDTAGLTSTTQITVTIQGANDTPHDITGSLTIAENAANGATVGTLATSDVDTGDTFTYALTNDAGGRFTIDNSTGLVTVADGSLLNFENHTSHTIVVQATDIAGTAFSKTLTVTINDVNEAPVSVADTATAVEAGGVNNAAAGTNPSGNVLTNDSDVDAGDTKTITGVAAGSVASASGSVATSVTGTYGSVNIAADGSYTYTVDNTNSAVQALRTSSNTLTDVFTYTMRDTAGLTSTAQITVTIQGANDTPHDITGSLTIAENAANGATVGTLATSDVDTGDTFTYALTNDAGGRFTIDSATGLVTVADGSLLNFETNTSHTIVVQATDTAGAAFSKTLTVTINDVNEAPVSVADTATAVEAGGVNNAAAGTNPSGNVLSNDTDVDAGDTKTITGVAAGSVASASGFVATSVTGTYGSVNIAADGSYTYTVDNTNSAVQALRTSPTP